MNAVLSINHDFAALAVLGVTEYQAILIKTLTELEARAKTYRRSCACHSIPWQLPAPNIAG
ncbi:hypothetical protein [Halioxenophilus aromaticivorans]|uniref:Uncharacterized protein n=1 Tax=Halioxenophilus aromaticivorans TaxID=1306992 RepID=A0AAV3U1V4_9ALTE